MKSKFFVGFVLAFLLISLVSASTTTVYDIEPDCGSGYVGSVCQDFELDDEFDQVNDALNDINGDLIDHDGDIADLQDNVSDLGAGLDKNDKNDLVQWFWIWNGYKLIRANQDDIKDLQKDMEKNYKLDKRQWKKINQNGKEILVNAGQIDDLWGYMADNDARWSADASGTSWSRVYEYLYDEFINYLRTIFASKDEVVDQSEKIYELEAKVYFLENGMSYDAQGLSNQVAYLKAVDNGDAVFMTGDGYKCVTMNKICTKIN